MTSIDNEQIADILDDIGSLLEVDEASPFRIRAYRNAADSIRMLNPPLAEMVAEGKSLTELQDIGPAIAKKIEEIVRTGHLVYVDKLAQESGAGVLELLRIPGLGPKRVRLLRDELSVTSRSELREALESGRVRGLAGFGEKTEERLLRRLVSGDGPRNEPGDNPGKS